MSATLAHRGPDSDGMFVDGARRPRRAPALDHRPRHRRPADRERGRQRRRRAERRDLQLRGADARARARRTSLPHARRHRGARARVRGVGRRRSPSGCAACSPSRSGTRASAGSCSRATATGSSRSTTARRPTARVRVRAARAAARRDRPRRARGVPRLQLRAGSALDLRGHAQAAGRAPSRLERGRRAPALRAARADGETSEPRTKPSSSRSFARGMRDSVRAHLVSDVPVGVLLSGGVDSCLLAALAAEETGEPLRTFSIGFEERSFDELADARLVAERYGTSIASSFCSPTRRCSFRRSRTRSTSRSPTRPRCRRTSSRSSRPRT